MMRGFVNEATSPTDRARKVIRDRADAQASRIARAKAVVAKQKEGRA
jgi:hypothetical protein